MKNLRQRVQDPNFIISSSILLVCFFWIMDGFLDSILFHNNMGSFFDFILFDIPTHELFLRLFFIITFIIGGLLISKLLRRQSESDRRYNALFENMSNAVASYEDIPAYKKLEEAENALKKLNSFNQTIINTIPFGINIVDLQGKILFMTNRSKKIFGVDAIGKKCWEFFKDFNKQCESCPLKKGVNIGETKTVEIEDMFKEKIFQISYTGMYYEGKKAILSILQDITEQKKADKKIKEAIEMKSAFISVVSHELRTPLTSIKEGISIVFEEIPGELNSKQKNLLGIAKRNVDRLARLINNVLDFQKLGSGNTEFDIAENDINEVVEEVYTAMLPSINKKEIHMSYRITENLPTIRFDKDKIVQVLTNLINNAIKFTEKGSITIATNRSKNIIQVSVYDTGIGIKKDDIPQMFKKFQQIATSTGRKKGGTGLGLAISREIIERHKGKIWAESEFGKGTTLHFVLPIKEQRK
ncbi:MAG: ATP-binding protein [bacterium]